MDVPVPASRICAIDHWSMARAELASSGTPSYPTYSAGLPDPESNQNWAKTENETGIALPPYPAKQAWKSETGIEEYTVI